MISYADCFFVLDDGENVVVVYSVIFAVKDDFPQNAISAEHKSEYTRRELLPLRQLLDPNESNELS